MKNLNFENFEKLDLPFKVNRFSPNIGAEPVSYTHIEPTRL